MSNLSPLAYLCEHTYKLDLGVFTLQGTRRYALFITFWKVLKNSTLGCLPTLKSTTKLYSP